MRLLPTLALALTSVLLPFSSGAQVQEGQRTGFTWITPEDVPDTTFGAGYSTYSAVFPILNDYPGAPHIQMGLGSAWLTTRDAGEGLDDWFYTTIEGGIGWWHDTRFATATPKFIMGGVSYNFYAWANGPGAGQTGLLSNGQRDWSEPGGKYGVAQLSNALLWAPDGLNLKQGLKGELLGYGYQPLPLMDPLAETAGTDIPTGNQCWTLFLNSTNFKGPATFFMPTFWTEPVVTESPEVAGLFFDVQPSDQNIGFGIEHAITPAILAEDENGDLYGRVDPIQFPASGEDRSVIMDQIRVYSKDARWNDMQAWFGGGMPDETTMEIGTFAEVSLANEGGFIVGEISPYNGDFDQWPIDMEPYVETFEADEQTMGFQWDLDVVTEVNGMFVLPEFFKLDASGEWQPISADQVPESTELLSALPPSEPAPHLTYLTPLEPDCAFQDPEGPWNVPGPSAGPYEVDLGDGSTLTYYWYRFRDQPAVVHANLPETHLEQLQARVELMHTAWNHEMEYLDPPLAGDLATLDPGVIVQPPAGLEVGYVPIVTRQETSDEKVKVFILAGQSNMQGFGDMDPGGPNTLPDVIANDTEGEWAAIGEPGDWTVRDDVWVHFESEEGLIQTNATVGQGAYSGLIGPELMFAHALGDYYEEPVLIIKTAWGGQSLAVNFLPPSADGETGNAYTNMMEVVADVTANIGTYFPGMGITETEIAGFAWFQGWNDGEDPAYLAAYESNLYDLVNDVRTDLGNADLPVVIANSGHGGFELYPDLWTQDMQTIVAPAQEAVGCNDDLYGGFVGFVDTRPFWYDVDQSPSEAIHHFNDNALTFLEIGRGLGEEMIRAINCEAFCTPLGIHEDLALSPVAVYPNPTPGPFRLESAQGPIARIDLFDASGRWVRTWPNVHATTVALEVDGPPGNYLLQVMLVTGERAAYSLVKQ